MEQRLAYSEEHFLDLEQVDLLPRERWSATHCNADKGEQTAQQGPGLMMAVTTCLFFVGEHGCDDRHDEVSRPHTISHPVDFAQFLSTILACPAEIALVLLHLFSRDLDQQHHGCNFAACAL